jgi:hypothetical protein
MGSCTFFASRCAWWPRVDVIYDTLLRRRSLAAPPEHTPLLASASQGAIAMPNGKRPTLIGLPAMPLAMWIGVTEPEALKGSEFTT